MSVYTGPTFKMRIRRRRRKRKKKRKNFLKCASTCSIHVYTLCAYRSMDVHVFLQSFIIILTE